MLELSAIIYLQPARPDHLIFNPCDFLLWCYLKDVFSAPIANLGEFQNEHILNVTPKTVRSVERVFSISTCYRKR